MRHYQQLMIEKADEIGPCGGSQTMRLVSRLADTLYRDGSSLDTNNRVLAVLTLIEAMVGTDRVGDVLCDLSEVLEEG